MILRILTALILSCSVTMAGQGMGPGPGVKGYVAAGDSEITAYFNANSATDGQALTKGAGNVTIPGAFTTTTGSVGNAIYANDTSWTTWSFPTSGNISASAGTIGFYFNPIAYEAGSMAFNGTEANGEAVPKFYLMYTGSSWAWSYRSSYQHITLSQNTVAFVEFAWNNSSNLMSYRINGGSWAEISVTGTAVTLDTNLVFARNTTANITATWDQVIISNVYQKDIYAVRTSTSF